MIPDQTTPEIHDRSIKTMIKVMVLAVLRETNYNITYSAKQLGISRASLYRYMRKYDVKGKDHKAEMARRKTAQAK